MIKYGYLDQTDWTWEFDDVALSPVKLYGSLEALKK
jgi:hypothetical protein